MWVVQSACGEAAGSVARISGPRGNFGRHPARGRMWAGTTLVEETDDSDCVICGKRPMSENLAALCTSKGTLGFQTQTQRPGV